MTWFLDKDFLATLDLRAYDAEAIARRVGLPAKVVAEFVDPGRLYMVESCPERGWIAGANGDGQPTLVFLGEPRLASEVVEPLNAVSFDIEKREIATRAIPYDGALDDGESVLATLEDVIGFQHIGDAPVLAFKHPSIWHYAVVPFAFDLHDVATGSAEGDEAERVDEVREWITGGNFVLHCGNAYYMGPDGNVESS